MTQISRFRHLAIIYAVSLVLGGAVLWAAFTFLGPTPPRKVIMTAGPQGSAYHEFGKRYQRILAREGVELQLLPSNGAMENLDRLRDPESGVSVGFMQGGTTREEDSPHLRSLGTLFYEPLWIFYRGVQPFSPTKGIRVPRMSIGPHGSGTRALALRLLAMNEITEDRAQLLVLPHHEAGEALVRGQIDAALMANSWDSPIVQKLVSSEEIELLSSPRADAYAALLPFLDRLVVPEGVGNLAKNRPPSDVVLLAPKASLVVHEDLHPAIQYLLLDAASQIHSGPGIFQRPGQFPAPETIDLPLSQGARHYYKSGPPFLHRYLPFWMAVLVARTLVVLIPLLALVYPLLRSAPLLYEWRVRRLIYRLYGELKFLEVDLNARDRGQSVSDLIAQLDELEQRAHRLRIPAFYSHMPYTLRVHIKLVRDRLEQWPNNQSQQPSGRS